jgi:glycosyltransferase involved in cell wall biosynthesis
VIMFATFVKRVLFIEKREDVFFYWPIPDRVTDEEFEWYPKHPNIKYLRYWQHRACRTFEFLTVSRELDQMMSYNGVFWDWDVLITTRGVSVDRLKMLATDPHDPKSAKQKQVWLIETMPLMSFKSASVLQIVPDVQDLMSLSGYMAADKVFLPSYHEKKGILSTARRFLTPSHVLSLDKKIKNVCPTQFKDFYLKTPEERFRQDRQFVLTYAGRLERSSSNIVMINDIMVRQFAMKGDAIKLDVCTVTKGRKIFDEDVVEVDHPDRHTYWEKLKHKIDAIVIMMTEGGFNMTVFEALMLGVPVILLKADWAETMFGKDYPLYVSGETQAYAMIKELYDDYEGWYARFAQWQQEYLIPTYSKRFETDMLDENMYAAMLEYMEQSRKAYVSDRPSKATAPTVKIMKDWVDEHGLTEFKLFEMIDAIHKAKGGELDTIHNKIDKPDFRYGWALIWGTYWNDYRLAFETLWGWKDASIETGHMKKIT